MVWLSAFRMIDYAVFCDCMLIRPVTQGVQLIYDEWSTCKSSPTWDWNIGIRTKSLSDSNTCSNENWVEGSGLFCALFKAIIEDKASEY